MRLTIAGTVSQKRYELASPVFCSSYRITNFIMPYMWYNVKNEVFTVECETEEKKNTIETVTLNENFTAVGLIGRLYKLIFEKLDNDNFKITIKYDKGKARAVIEVTAKQNLTYSPEIILSSTFEKYLGFTTLNLSAGQLQDTEIYQAIAEKRVDLNSIVLYLGLPQFVATDSNPNHIVSREWNGNAYTKIIPVNASFGDVIVYNETTEFILNVVPFYLSYFEIYIFDGKGEIIENIDNEFWIELEIN